MIFVVVEFCDSMPIFETYFHSCFQFGRAIMAVAVVDCGCGDDDDVECYFFYLFVCLFCLCGSVLLTHYHCITTLN